MLRTQEEGDTIAKKITINEKNANFQYGYSKDVMNAKRRVKPIKGIWSDDVAEMLMKCNIKIKNMEEAVCIKTANKTIMDYAERCVEYEKISFKMLAAINCVRMHKKLHFSCEFIGALGRCETK